MCGAQCIHLPLCSLCPLTPILLHIIMFIRSCKQPQAVSWSTRTQQQPRAQLHWPSAELRLKLHVQKLQQRLLRSLLSGAMQRLQLAVQTGRRMLCDAL